jgi:2-polyprenyl-6-methoxyphenol hydroxylase-like FAD-dependent oxidoreductase
MGAVAVAAVGGAAGAPLRVAVVGGSIGGLSAATALHRLGAFVTVFEAQEAGFEGRGSSMGFCDVAMWESLAGRRMVRRGQQASRAQGAWFYGDLWRFWRQCLPEGSVRLGSRVTSLGDAARPTIDGEEFDLAIVADGGWSELRAKYFGAQPEPEYAGWQAWRFKVLEEDIPGGFASEGMYGDGSFYDVIMLKVATDDGRDFVMGGTAVACPESAVARPQVGANRQTSLGAGSAASGAAAASTTSSTTPDWFMPFFKERFGSVARGELVKVMEAAARRGKITPQPQYHFAASQVVQGRVVLIGDAAHMGVPRTAAGAHTAVMDSVGLAQAFGAAMRAGGTRAAVIGTALAAYEPQALARARQLFERSVQTSVDVLPPGWSREAARQVITPQSAAAMSETRLRAELAARRIPAPPGRTGRAALLEALLTAVTPVTATAV